VITPTLFVGHTGLRWVQLKPFASAISPFGSVSSFTSLPGAVAVGSGARITRLRLSTLYGMCSMLAVKIARAAI
jgi:hypothetical protein